MYVIMNVKKTKKRSTETNSVKRFDYILLYQIGRNKYVSLINRGTPYLNTKK
jgi:hypothetical protein